MLLGGARSARADLMIMNLLGFGEFVHSTPFWLQREGACIGRSEKMRATVALAIAAVAAFVAGGLQVSAQESYADRFAEYASQAFENSSRDDEEYLRFEWEGYDGWYNNPAHPDWGGAGRETRLQLLASVQLYALCFADMPLERKTPVAYPDGVYEIAGKDRPNVLLIANVTQNGLTGFGSRERTALFIFFGELTVGV